MIFGEVVFGFDDDALDLCVCDTDSFVDEVFSGKCARFYFEGCLFSERGRSQ